MVQDETEGAAATAVPRHRRLIVAGVVASCALGAALGLWARPVLTEQAGAPQAEPAPEPLPPGRKLQIVVNDGTPTPAGQAAAASAWSAPRTAAPAERTPEILTAAPPAAWLPRTKAQAAAEPSPQPPPAGPTLAQRAAPLARGLLASAEAALLRIAEIKVAPAPTASAQRSAGPAPEAAATAARSESRRLAEARGRAEAHRRAQARRLARMEAKKKAAAEQAKAAEAARLAAAAEARAERIALRAEARRKAQRLAEKAEAEKLAQAAERRRAARLAAQERTRAKAAALAEARAEARAKAAAEARAEAQAERRRKDRLAVLAHSLAKPRPHRAKPAEAPPAAAPAPRPPIRGAGPLRLASAPRCASSDPGAALACADPQLGAAERRMNRAYQQAVAAGVPAAELKRQQQKWLATRAAAAREAPWAVRDVYQARIAELEDMARSPHD